MAIDPPKPCWIEVRFVQRRLGIQVPVERLHVAQQPRVRVVVEQVPVEAAVVVPFAPLPEFRAHEEQLLPGMAEHEPVQRPQRRVFLPRVSWHLVEERALAVDDLVV